MIGRTLTLAGGLAGAVALSQFPEYSQQYTQRLAGAVDELSQVVHDFDRSAEAEGLSRAEALAAMTGTPFVERRRSDMTRTIARYERLTADLSALRSAGPFTRAYNLAHIDDPTIARRAAADFRPAVPLSFEGIIFAAAGLLVGSFVVMLLRELLGALMMPFRRRTA